MSIRFGIDISTKNLTAKTSDGSLLKTITQKVKDDSDEKLKVSYGIYSNTYGRNFSYVVSHASKIQEINF